MPTAPRPTVRQVVLLVAILLVALLTLVVAVRAVSAHAHRSAGTPILRGPGLAAASLHMRVPIAAGSAVSTRAGTRAE